MFKKISETINSKPIWGWLIFAATMVVVFSLGLLAASITERRAEIATIYANKVVEIEGIEPDNNVWGLNYPREYDTWLKTQEMNFASKHMGNKPKDELENRPAMVILWAGYAFSRDYSAPRGHMHAITDIHNTLRVGAPDSSTPDMQPSTCWSCKSPDVPRLIEEQGTTEFYKAPWSKNGKEVVNPIGCADCHDPKTAQLTISRPALVEAFARQGKDINAASPQEMRSLVCAQCHVEYYFKGKDKYLTFPWDEGMNMESMEEYYDNYEYSDFTHALSKAPIIKAQHPDYELFLLGPHGQRDISCADCHMPYKSEGGIKFSNHHVASPLMNIGTTCLTCHREEEETLRDYVYEYQDKILETRNRVETELAKAHIMAKLAWDNGVKEDQMKEPLQLIRQAQWRWDFGVASHGASFHAPVETQRILSHSLDRSLLAQLKLQKLLIGLGVGEFNMPDISTKAKAQEYIGLDMAKLKDSKNKWKENTLPSWAKNSNN